MAGFDAVREAPDRWGHFRRSLEPGGGPAALWELKAKLTPRCNLRCRMCGYWRRTGEVLLDARTWKRILSEAAALGCRKAHFSGGEVLTRPDFFELAAHAAGLGLRVNLTTNGTLLDRAAAKALVRARVRGVSISLDGPDARSHDAVRGEPGAFKAAVKAARLLTDPALGRRRPEVRVNFVLMRDNYRDLPRMVDLAGKLGAADLVPMPVDEKGASRNRLSKRQILEFNRDIAPQAARLRRGWGLPASFERTFPFGVTEEDVRHCKKGLYARGAYSRRPCLAPWLHLFIAWDGAVYPCCMSNGRVPPLGNAGAAPLADVFNGPGFVRLRESFWAGRQIKACGSCDLFLQENARLHEALARAGGPRPGPPRPPASL